MNVIIERNNPLPDAKRGRYSTKYSFLSGLKKGENVLVSTEHEAYSVRDAMRYRGMKYAFRKSKDGWRIWYLGDKK